MVLVVDEVIVIPPLPIKLFHVAAFPLEDRNWLLDGSVDVPVPPFVCGAGELTEAIVPYPAIVEEIEFS